MKSFSTTGQSHNKTKLQGIAVIVGWLLLWGILSLTRNAFYLPSPIETLQTLVNLFKQQTTYIIIGMSLLRVAIGLGLAIVLGIVLGLLSSLSNKVYIFMQPLMVAIKSTPVVSFIILAFIYMNKAFVPSFCGMLLCFPIIYYNVIEGYRTVDASLISMSTVYKVPLKRKLLKLYLPSIAPYLFAGILTSIGICWKGTIAAEVISVLNTSIGNEIYNGKIYLDTASVFAWTVIIIVASLSIERAVKKMMTRNNYYKQFKVI